MKLIKKAIMATMATVIMVPSPVFAAEYESTDQNAQTDVYAQIGSEFSIILPKSITLSGADKTGSYDISFTGDVAGNECVKVIPDASFELKSDSKQSVNATIQQEVINFFSDKTTRTLEKTDAKLSDGATGDISAENMSAGAWNGAFNFNVSLRTVENEEEVDSNAGLYDADMNLIMSYKTFANTYNFDVEKDYAYADQPLKGADLDGKILVLPENITKIGNCTFNLCNTLKSVIIPEGVVSIGNNAFNGCRTLESVRIPESVTSIGLGAFYGCTSFTEIVIPKNIQSIGIDAFASCFDLKSVKLPDSSFEMGSGVFSYCTFTSIDLPKEMTIIPERAFLGSELYSITIPEKVTTIGASAFSHCPSLESVTIPESVTSIETTAFKSCGSLSKINYRGTEEQWNAISKAEGWDKYSDSIVMNYSYTGE